MTAQNKKIQDTKCYFNNDSLSCETNQSQRFQMNGQKIVVVVVVFLHSDGAVFVLRNYRTNITAQFSKHLIIIILLLRLLS